MLDVMSENRTHKFGQAEIQLLKLLVRHSFTIPVAISCPGCAGVICGTWEMQGVG